MKTNANNKATHGIAIAGQRSRRLAGIPGTAGVSPPSRGIVGGTLAVAGKTRGASKRAAANTAQDTSETIIAVGTFAALRNSEAQPICIAIVPVAPSGTRK